MGNEVDVFLDIIAPHLNAPDKKRVFRVFRNYATRLEQWAQIEISMALENEIDDGKNKNSFFYDWRIERDTGTGHSCDLIVTTRPFPNNKTPSPADDDLWVEMKWQTTVGNKNRISEDINKQKAFKQIRGKGHFIVLAILVVSDSEKSKSQAELIQNWLPSEFAHSQQRCIMDDKGKILAILAALEV